MAIVDFGRSPGLQADTARVRLDPVVFHFQNHEVLIGIFFTLFSAWTLLGWCVGEAWNVKWLRGWCAPTFVVSVALIAATVGALAGRGYTKAKTEANVSELLDVIRSELEAGRSKTVLHELNRLEPDGDGDLGDVGTLKKISGMTSRLREQPTNVARSSTPPHHL